MPVLSARGLSKSFGARVLFEDLAVTLRRHERVGLLGDNGAGKSTLLKVLAGSEPADGGVIERRRNSRVMVLDQNPEFPPEETPREIIQEGLVAWKSVRDRYELVNSKLESDPSDAQLMDEQGELSEQLQALGGWSVDHLIEDVAHRLGLPNLDQPIGTMSGGERRRVALAQLLVARPDLAILDEPTNHLDTDTIAWLESYLVESFPGAVLVVTHDRYFLDAICQRVFELSNGALQEYEGNYTDFLAQRAEQDAHAARAEQNRQNLARREQAWLRRGAKARSTKQKARIGRALEIINLEPPPERQHVSFSEVGRESQRLGKTILDAENLSLAIGEKRLIEGLTLRLVPGDRIGIVGRNGAGKTSLLRAILGELAPVSGKLTLGQNTKIALIDQGRQNLRDDWSVFDNVAGFEGALSTGGGYANLMGKDVTLKTYIEHFGFDGQAQRRALRSLSGGERARVALASILREGANLLLLDEPTNDLDTATLAAVEELLESFQGCALVVSHDRAFLDNVATGILAFEGSGRVVAYPGNYETYTRLRPTGDSGKASASKAPEAPPASETKSAPAPTQKPLTYQERKDLEGMMDRIAIAEAEEARLGERLNDPAIYADPNLAKRLRAEHEIAAAAVFSLMERWEALEQRKDIKK